MSISAVILQINLLAVLVSGVVHLVSGLIWFQPALFGMEWARLTGKSLQPATRWIPAGVIGHLVISFVLAIIIRLAGATTILDGILIGALVWIGFVVTLEVGELIWEKIPFRLFLIRIGNQLVGYCLSGVILAVWP